MVDDLRSGRIPLGRTGWPVAVLCVTVALLVTIWTPWFIDYDEAVYAEVARGMWESGRMLAPTWNGAPFVEKPLLFYWLAGPLFSLLGLTPIAVRLVSVAGAAALLTGIGRFLERRASQAAAESAVWVAGAALLPFCLGRLGLLDALLTAAVTVALLAFFLALESEPSRLRRRLLVLGYVAAGAGMAVKGPAFPLLIGAILMVDAIWRGDFLATLKRSGLVWGAPLLLAVGVPSNLPLLTAETRSGGFFLAHNLDRAVSAMQGHGGAVWYYLPVLAVAVLPFTALLPGAVSTVRATDSGSARLARFCLVWAVVVTAAFSLVATKLPHYIAPVVPALAILVGLDVARGSRRRRGWAATVVLSAGFGCVLAALPWLAASAPPLIDAEALARVPEVGFVPSGPFSRIAMGALGAGLFGSALFAARAATRLGPRIAVRRLGLGACAVWSLLWLGVGHAASVAWQEPLRRLSQAADAALPEGDEIVLVEMNHRVTPTLATGRHVLFLRANRAAHVAELRRRLQPGGVARIVMPGPVWSDLQSRVEGREVLRDGPYVLIGPRARATDRAATPPGG